MGVRITAAQVGDRLASNGSMPIFLGFASTGLQGFCLAQPLMVKTHVESCFVLIGSMLIVAHGSGVPRGAPRFRSLQVFTCEDLGVWFCTSLRIACLWHCAWRKLMV